MVRGSLEVGGLCYVDSADVQLGAFLHYLTEDWTDSNKFHGTGWANTEYRSYTFAPEQLGDARLTETTESRRRRLS